MYICEVFTLESLIGGRQATYSKRCTVCTMPCEQVSCYN